MKKAIKSWGKYVPWPVVHILMNSGVDTVAEKKEVTVFFSDIASFTTIVENLDPEQSLLLLSRYFNDMSKVIDDHGGIVIEFIGDAILGVFGEPRKNEAHASAAVKATLRMLLGVQKINEWSSRMQLPELSIRCGVHSGTTLVGNMGFNTRMKYGVLGATIPGRLEELNKSYSTDMLISEATYRKLDSAAGFIVRPIDYIYLSVVDGDPPEPVYQVLGREKLNVTMRKIRPAADKHAIAMSYYVKRKFKQAAHLYHEVNEMIQALTGVEEDVASRIMMKRSRFYAASPPPPEWDGVWDQKSEPS